jgi:hypothetical protein
VHANANAARSRPRHHPDGKAPVIPLVIPRVTPHHSGAAIPAMPVGVDAGARSRATRRSKVLRVVQATFRARLHPCPDRARCTRSRSWPAASPSGPNSSTRPNARSVPSKPPTPGGTATPTAPGSRGPSREATRRSDLHQARYRGLAKTHLQHVLTASARNVVRVDAWLSGIPPGGAWASRLTRLQAASSLV